MLLWYTMPIVFIFKNLDNIFVAIIFFFNGSVADIRCYITLRRIPQ